MSRKSERNLVTVGNPDDKLYRQLKPGVQHDKRMGRARLEKLANKPIPFVNRHTERAYYKRARLQFNKECM